MSSYSPMIEKIHNFGIYLKKGKRAILQLDFPGRTFNIIQRGHVKKTIKFENLQHFDSAEDLHIVLKLDEAELEFTADNSEEKYTICRLLSLVIDSPESVEYTRCRTTVSPDSSPQLGGVCVLPPVSLRQEKVLKDGILEKKGNTTITTWNKRRVKISAGEFSYYKPGEQLALNIVQIWDGSCYITRSGTNGFSIIIRDSRTYSFRCFGDSKSKLSVEDERDDWVKVFEKAIKTRRNTLVYIDDGIPHSQTQQEASTVQPPTSSIPETQEIHIQEQIAEENSSNTQYSQRNPEITAHLSVSVSYVTEQSPASKRQAVTTPTTTSSQPNVSTHVPIHVPISSRVIPSQSSSSPENVYSLQTTIPPTTAASAISPIQAKTFTQTQDEPVRDIDEPSVANARALFEAKIRSQMSETDIIENKERKKRLSSVPDSLISPTPPVPPPPLPVSSGPPPPPPPLLNVKRAGVKLVIQPSTKLKPAHWNKISNSAATHSIWKDMRDVTKSLNLVLLEEQFRLKEKDDKRISKDLTDTSSKKILLLDQKRAHVLGIIVNSMKISGNIRMTDVLSTIRESDTFPSETLSTIRSCQPTDDDIEMYKAYKGSRDDLMPVDKFIMELCEVPKIGLRLELIQIIWEFPKTYEAVQEEVDDIWTACEEVVECTKLINVLEYILAIGNQLNSKWSSGYGVRGFELTSIDKVLQVKGKGNNTVLTYLVSTLRKNDPDLLNWTASLGHVPIAAEYSVKAISAEIEVLKNDIIKVKKNMKILKPVMSSNQDKKFQMDVQSFVSDYEKKLDKLDAKSQQLTSKYTKTLESFGEKSDRPSDVFFTCIHHFMDQFQQTRGKPHK